MKKQKFIFPSFFWPLIIYTALSLVSSFLSINPEASLKDSKELLLFLIVPIIYTGFSEENVLKKANLALLASAYLSCLYSFFYFFFKAPSEERIAGFMGHYMTQAGLLLLFSCMALSILIFSHKRIRYFWGLGFLLSFVVLTLTLTRSAWVGLVVASSLILFLYKPRALVIVPLAIGLFYLASPQLIKKRALSSFSLTSNMNRINYMRAGIKIIKEYPLFGTGPDTVEMALQNPKFRFSKRTKEGVHLHNNILQIGAERGIPTLLAWLIFMVWVFISLIKLLKNKDPTLYPLTVAALAALFALFTAGLFEYNFADSEITMLFLYMITIPFSLARIQRKTVQKRYIKARLANLIPDFIKPILRSLYRAFKSSLAYKKIMHHPKSCNELHNYWRHPWDNKNLPQSYLEGKARSQFLVKIMKKYVSTNAKILEIGCNVGRNLKYLFLADFRNLQGIEISEKAVRLLKQYFHEMANHTKIYRMPVEEIIREFEDCEFDTVFTMAVLEHIHEESEWIFPEIVRIIKDFLITVEDESDISWRHFPRNYKNVFEPFGMKQIEEINCSDIDGLGRNFIARIFKKKI